MGLFSKFIKKVRYRKDTTEKQKDIDEINEILEKHRQESSYFENSVYFETHKGWFDYYSNEKEFLESIVHLISDGNLTYTYEEDSLFADCLNYLVENNYLISSSDYSNKDIFDLLNDSFSLGINKNNLIEAINLKYDKYKKYYNKKKNAWLKEKFFVIELCEVLKPKGLGLIYLYSTGDIYCYGILKLDKLNQVRNLFENLTDE